MQQCFPAGSHCARPRPRGGALSENRSLYAAERFERAQPRPTCAAPIQSQVPRRESCCHEPRARAGSARAVRCRPAAVCVSYAELDGLVGQTGTGNGGTWPPGSQQGVSGRGTGRSRAELGCCVARESGKRCWCENGWWCAGER